MQPLLPEGIRVEAGTTQQQAIVGVENRPTAFIGSAQRGPLNAPTLLRSFDQYLKIFGALANELPLSHAVNLYFKNGGRQALVVRVAHQATHAAIHLQADDTPLCLWSLFPGAHEHLRAAVDYDGIDATDADCFNLTVQRLATPGTERVIDQEIYRYVSLSPEHPSFAPRALAGSRLVRVDDHIPSTRPYITLNHHSGHAEFFRGITVAGRQGGRLTMADVLGSSDDRSGLFALTEQHAFGQLYIPPLANGVDVSVPVLRAAARFCERRRSLLITDAPRAWKTAEEVSTNISRFSLRGPNVAMYFPWLKVASNTSPAEDEVETILVPPGGAAAGALDRIAESEGMGAAPAGQHMFLRGINDLASRLDDKQSFAMSKLGVNTLRYAKGGRKVLWDAVLLMRQDEQAESMQASLRVRRIVQYVSRSVEQGLQWVAFEQHSEKLWHMVELRVNEFLSECLQRGLLVGTMAGDAWEVDCSLRTNPTALRTTHQLGLDIRIAPLLPSRFVKLSLTVPTAGGSNFG